MTTKVVITNEGLKIFKIVISLLKRGDYCNLPSIKREGNVYKNIYKNMFLLCNPHEQTAHKRA